jgi:hypothetical protein
MSQPEEELRAAEKHLAEVLREWASWPPTSLQWSDWDGQWRLAITQARRRLEKAQEAVEKGR